MTACAVVLVGQFIELAHHQRRIDEGQQASRGRAHIALRHIGHIGIGRGLRGDGHIHAAMPGGPVAEGEILEEVCTQLDLGLLEHQLAHLCDIPDQRYGNHTGPEYRQRDRPRRNRHAGGVRYSGVTAVFRYPSNHRQAPEFLVNSYHYGINIPGFNALPGRTRQKQCEPPLKVVFQKREKPKPGCSSGKVHFPTTVIGRVPVASIRSILRTAAWQRANYAESSVSVHRLCNYC